MAFWDRRPTGCRPEDHVDTERRAVLGVYKLIRYCLYVLQNKESVDRLAKRDVCWIGPMSMGSYIEVRMAFSPDEAVFPPGMAMQVGKVGSFGRPAVQKP
jgi:hypothetical protein